MLNDIIQDFARQMESRIQEMSAEFAQRLDFAGLEKAITEECARFSAELQQAMLEPLFLEEIFLEWLKIYAGRRGMRFKERRTITVTLSNGHRIKVSSPYFVKAWPHGRRRKRGPNGTGAHFGLDILGFIGYASPGLLSDVLQMALLCPSYDVASTVLKGRRIKLDVKAIRRLCSLAGSLDNELRGRIALSGEENLSGLTQVISIDGGRLRERKRKRGRKTARLKRLGYRTDWREPKLFTLYLIDEKGDIVKKFKPLHDATMGDHEAMFALLENYLRSLDIKLAERIVFCGDGSEWIWNGVKKLIKRMELDESKVHQVLDWTHAWQNLYEIVKLVAPGKQDVAAEKWEYLLWNGLIDALENSIKETVTGKTKREQALKKFAGYFATNRERMQYARFKALGLPRGSGHVESAIRRVINLRLKAPGTFWLKDMAECFLFLRSQLLSGRWEIFMGNLTALKRRTFWPVYAANQDLYDLPETA